MKEKGGNGFDHGRIVAAPDDAALRRMLGDMVGGVLGDAGHVLERRDHPEEALLLFRKAVEATPDDPRAWYDLGDTLLALERWEEARTSLERALALGGNGWLVRYDLGLALYHLGQYEDAANLFREIIGSDGDLRRAPANPLLNATTTLALCYGELGRWKDALTTLHPALSAVAGTLCNVARFHLRDGNPRAARRYFVMAAELEPGSEDILHGAGAALMKLGEWKEAEHHLRRATRLQPPCADAWYDLGVTYAKQRKTSLRKAARRCFARALKIDPTHAWAHYDLACLDALARDRDGSFRHLRRAIDLGLTDRKHVLRDPDLKLLRRDPRWKDIVSRLPA